MHSVDFNKLWNHLHAKEVDLQKSKGKQYATDDNVLQTINNIAKAEGRKPSEVCLTMLLKHVFGVIKSKDAPLDWTTPDGAEGLLQKIADVRTWALLFAAARQDQDKQEKDGYDKKSGEPEKVSEPHYPKLTGQYMQINKIVNPVQASADQWYAIYLNGEFVGDSVQLPNGTFNPPLPVVSAGDTLKMSPHIQAKSDA